MTNQSGRSHVQRVGALVLTLAVSLTACGGAKGQDAEGTAGTPTATEATPGNGQGETATGGGEPIKVGLLAPTSGVYGFYGPILEAAMKAALVQEGAVDGRPIELVIEDTATDPQVALSKAETMVNRDGVELLVCCVNGAANLAVGQFLDGTDVPQIAPIPGPKGLEAYGGSFSVGFHPEQLTVPFGRYAVEELGHQRAILFASDFVQGHLVVDGFRKGFEAAGGEIVDEIYPPLDTSDYAPFLSQISGADIVFSFFGGADAIRVSTQWDEAGLKDQVQLIGLGPLLTKLVLPQIGEPAVGLEAIFHYAEDGVETAGQADFEALLGDKIPADQSLTFVHANGYATAKVLVEVLRTVGDDLSRDALISALETVEVEAPWGPLNFDAETGYPIVPGYHYRVVQGEDGALHHEVIDVLEGLEP
jgi:branched-chain amino acid transport system substrate-binding protein